MTALTERELTPEAPAAAPPSLERSAYSDQLFKGLLTVAAAAIPILLGFLVYELWGGARLAMGKFGFDFVTSSTWDPVKGRIVGDEEANKLLRRPYRAGYTHPEVGTV